MHKDADVWKCRGEGVLECHWRGLLQVVNLKSWVCFALQNPLTPNPLLLCFRVTPAWLLLDFPAVVELKRSSRIRQSLFQVISCLRNLGDLPGKHLRGGKETSPKLNLCVTSQSTALVCQLILIHVKTLSPLLWRHHGASQWAQRDVRGLRSHGGKALKGMGFWVL